MQYKGFIYDPWLEEEDDNRKIFHTIQGPNGVKGVEPDWFANISPYSYATKEQFERAVDELYFEYWATNKT
jgi:hypothetical protein